MSPRAAASLRGADQSLRDHLITTAARLIAERGSAGLTVRDIASAAQVAGGALYNHFDDKEELLAHALALHVRTTMRQLDPLPRPGEATVAQNLNVFITKGLGVLSRILPAFVGFFPQHDIMTRAMMLVGEGGHGIPALLTGYLTEEQSLGRIRADAKPAAAAQLIIGACHDLILPRLLADPSAAAPIVPAGFADDVIEAVLHGIAPR